MKNEFFYFKSWQGVTIPEFATMLGDYLEFYNDGRIKQSLGWMSPNDTEGAGGWPRRLVQRIVRAPLHK